LGGGEAAGPLGASPIVVEGFEPYSVAPQQGCKAGDLLVAVNGVVVVGKTMVAVHRSFKRAVGETNTLRLRDHTHAADVEDI
jgi:hypothetical protein